MEGFELLKWWVNAAEFKGLQVLGQHAINPLTFPVTTTVTEGSFCILKGLLTPDWQYMDPETQMLAHQSRSISDICLLNCSLPNDDKFFSKKI